jgi:hypothetical protein
MNKPIAMVVFSDGKHNELREMTQNCVHTAMIGSAPNNLHITVVDNSGFKYKDCVTVSNNKDFNYNAFANDFVREKINYYDHFIICNNDLIFGKNWLTPLIEANYPIVSSISPGLKKQSGIKNNEIGYTNKVHFSPWCFMIDKKTWTLINGFDEDFAFWYADDSLLEQLKKIETPPMIIPASKVTHLRSRTILKIEDAEYKSGLTERNYELFFNKYIKIK